MHSYLHQIALTAKERLRKISSELVNEWCSSSIFMFFISFFLQQSKLCASLDVISYGHGERISIFCLWWRMSILSSSSCSHLSNTCAAVTNGVKSKRYWVTSFTDSWREKSLSIACLPLLVFPPAPFFQILKSSFLNVSFTYLIYSRWPLFRHSCMVQNCFCGYTEQQERTNGYIPYKII